MMPQLSFVFLHGVLLVTAFPADSIAEPSLSILRLKPSVYKDGDTGVIVCFVDKVKDPVEWISPSGETVGNSSKNRRLYVERVPKHENMLAILVFESTKLTDSGNWTCKSNYLKDTVEIVVKENEIEEIEADEGKNAKLTCEAIGNAESNVTWYKELHSKTSDVKISIFQNSKYVIGKENNTYTLEIRRLTPEDAVKYTCEFSQEALDPYTRKTFILAVNQKVVMAIKFEELLEDDEGKNVQLTCEAKGYPEPTVTWYKDNVGITDDSKYLIKKAYNTYTLEIRNLTQADSGEYMCKATQEALTHYTQKSIELNVHQNNSTTIVVAKSSNPDSTSGNQ